MNMINSATKLPTQDQMEIAKDSSRILAKYTKAKRVRLKIQGDQDELEELILPEYVLEALLDILVEISRGNAFSIIPVHAQLSTQEAANILNVSRPFLVSLLEDKKIPYHKVGTHRRVLAKDLFFYKKQIDKDRLKTLEELTALSQELGMGYDD
ncbi:Excisionase domain protein [hydrothermal vent metagenome]|uniref:Excisionase domain protein n=1 Tax=hydrothermal vent metagenome TaxID=652676 RepID=A0A3B0YM15_9ZZZZ